MKYKRIRMEKCLQNNIEGILRLKKELEQINILYKNNI